MRTIILALALVFLLPACGGGDDATEETNALGERRGPLKNGAWAI